MQEVNRRFLLLDAEPLDQLSLRLKRQKAPDFVVIDSFQYTQMTYAQYIKFKEQHRNKLLIFISHASGKNPDGPKRRSISGPKKQGNSVEKTFTMKMKLKMRTTTHKPITPQQLKALHATFHRIGMDDDARHDCISSFTDGRTQSSKELSFDEARRLLASLNEDQAEKAREEAKKLVKAIFCLSFQISFLNKGYTNDTQEEFQMNVAKLNVFARSKSASRKNVSEMYPSELKAFKKQLEAIAYNENNKSKNKRS